MVICESLILPTKIYKYEHISYKTSWTLGFLVARSKKILDIPRDRGYLHFAETSSRPSKATLKVVKIATFTLQNLPEEREIENNIIE